MKEIAKTNYYEINVDKSKNRIYLKVIGYWKNPDVVSDYVPDMVKATKAVEPGFTILEDLRESEVHPKEVGDLHVQVLKKMVEAGLDRTAEVVTSLLVKAEFDREADQAHMKKQDFSTIEEAEAWLDS